MRVVLFGTGAVAKMARHYLATDSPHEVVACTGDRGYLPADEVFGLPAVPFDEVAAQFPPTEHAMFVAVGYSRMNDYRAERCRRAKDLGYELISYVSSRATVDRDVPIGDNCFVMEDVVVQPFVRVGSNVILWSACHVGHESVIEDSCFVSSHAVVSGFVTVGRNSFLGSNCTIRDGVTIGARTVVGAGAVVMKDTPERSVLAAPRAQLLAATSDRLPGL